MKALIRLCGIFTLLVLLGGIAQGQISGPKVSRVEIKHAGPPSVSDELIRANIHIKPGDTYQPAVVDEDIRNLYATGLFYNIRVAADREGADIVLTYVVQGKLRLTDIKFSGNKKYSDARLLKKVTSKVGDPLDERKLFTDSQTIQEMYQKSGYPGTEVKATVVPDEAAGRASVTFEVKENYKIRIVDVEFVGAQAFSQRTLRKQIKTRRHWMFSWLTGSGVFKDEQFKDDRERLAEFYRGKGYIDFEIKDVQFEYPTPRRMIVRWHIYEGQPYKVGAITFDGTTMLPTNAVSSEFDPGALPKNPADRRSWFEKRDLHRSFPMKEGDTFTSKGMSKDTAAVEDFYGAKGHIDVQAGSPNLRVQRIANTEKNTMDLNFKVDEGQQSHVEKIEIRGNVKTKDKVIRRELTIAPGDVFNMVAVKRSKARLENMQYFEKVDTRAEDTDVPGRKNLIVGVEEKQTGNFSLGAGFSSVDAVVGFVEVSQGNFDLFNPPTFTGGGQKFRLRLQLGTRRQDYVLSFVEPWFLDRKLALGVELYHRDLNFQSIEDLYDETRTGTRLSLTRALWSDFLIGSISYTIENVGINLESGLHDTRFIPSPQPGRPGEPLFVLDPRNVPQAILDEAGSSLVSKVGLSLAYDTRNSTLLPDAGQRTEVTADFAGGPLGGDSEYYRIELKSAWYFRGFAKGHVIEIVGRTGVADGINGDTVPFYDRYYLGGLYSLRGFRYRGISPREANPAGGFFAEPVGGNTYWFGTAEYSIPIVQKERMGGVRFAVFYDIGSVETDAYDFNFSHYSDNWGIGLRLNLPIGPLRLDYGIPLNHDRFSSGSGKFQFGVGYTREF